MIEPLTLVGVVIISVGVGAFLGFVIAIKAIMRYTTEVSEDLDFGGMINGAMEAMENEQ